MKKSAASNRFRARLRDELEQWKAEGIVQADQAEAISRRYTLDELGRESTGALVLAIYMIGAVLICCGLISLVAWHWDRIPAAAKIVLIVAAMLACHVGGFHLWKVTGRRAFLGHSLVGLLPNSPLASSD